VSKTSSEVNIKKTFPQNGQTMPGTGKIIVTSVAGQFAQQCFKST